VMADLLSDNTSSYRQHVTLSDQAEDSEPRTSRRSTRHGFSSYRCDLLRFACRDARDLAIGNEVESPAR
jgi:hypothetical protein